MALGLKNVQNAHTKTYRKDSKCVLAIIFFFIISHEEGIRMVPLEVNWERKQRMEANLKEV
jgi:hypothetical protein